MSIEDIISDVEEEDIDNEDESSENTSNICHNQCHRPNRGGCVTMLATVIAIMQIY